VKTGAEIFCAETERCHQEHVGVECGSSQRVSFSANSRTCAAVSAFWWWQRVIADEGVMMSCVERPLKGISAKMKRRTAQHGSSQATVCDKGRSQ
jgi:hypothetical protein